MIARTMAPKWRQEQKQREIQNEKVVWKICLMIIMFCGCAPMFTLMVHPDGRTAECHGGVDDNFGFKNKQKSCIEAYEKLGFKEVK